MMACMKYIDIGKRSKCGRMKRITKHTKERLWWGKAYIAQYILSVPLSLLFSFMVSKREKSMKRIDDMKCPHSSTSSFPAWGAFILLQKLFLCSFPCRFIHSHFRVCTLLFMPIEAEAFVSSTTTDSHYSSVAVTIQVSLLYFSLINFFFNKFNAVRGEKRTWIYRRWIFNYQLSGGHAI